MYVISKYRANLFQPFVQAVHDVSLVRLWHIGDVGTVVASWLDIDAHIGFLAAIEPCAYSAGAPWVGFSIDENHGGVFVLKELNRMFVERGVEFVMAQFGGEHDFVEVALCVLYLCPFLQSLERIAVVSQFANCLHIEWQVFVWVGEVVGA